MIFRKMMYEYEYILFIFSFQAQTRTQRRIQSFMNHRWKKKKCETERRKRKWVMKRRKKNFVGKGTKATTELTHFFFCSFFSGWDEKKNQPYITVFHVEWVYDIYIFLRFVYDPFRFQQSKAREKRFYSNILTLLYIIQPYSLMIYHTTPRLLYSVYRT